MPDRSPWGLPTAVWTPRRRTRGRSGVFWRGIRSAQSESARPRASGRSRERQAAARSPGPGRAEKQNRKIYIGYSFFKLVVVFFALMLAVGRRWLFMILHVAIAGLSAVWAVVHYATSYLVLLLKPRASRFDSRVGLQYVINCWRLIPV